MRLNPLPLLAALLVACSGQPAESESSFSVQLIAQAEQSQPPALWVNSGAITAAWIGADINGVHQDARLILGNSIGERVILPLPPRQPYEQQILPAQEGNLHLFWLDRDSSGDMILYNALLATDLRIIRGPIPVTNTTTLHFVALPQSSGEVLILWSGGLIAEPTLHAQRIDSQGLILAEAQELAHAANWPAAIQANDGTIHLFWLNTATQTPRYARLINSNVSGLESLDRAFTLETGDRLYSLAAALDTTHVYLLWNITRSSGETQSGMIARPIGSATWDAPQRLGLGEAGTLNIETGFNSGRVQHVQGGEDWLSWVAPLPGQFDVLPVAAVVESELKLVYFQSGRMLAFQDVTPVTALLRPPLLRTDRDRYLYLAWAEPGESGLADLKLATTRPLNQ